MLFRRGYMAVRKYHHRFRWWYLRQVHRGAATGHLAAAPDLRLAAFAASCHVLLVRSASRSSAGPAALAALAAIVVIVVVASSTSSAALTARFRVTFGIAEPTALVAAPRPAAAIVIIVVASATGAA